MTQTPDTSLTVSGSRFEYSHLSGRHDIRLLLLESSVDSWPPRCSIRHVDLRSANYDALSYVWNEATSIGPHMPIRCDGQVLIVTPNLYDALHTIWTAYPTLLLWADQICIDQSSDLKKNHQVASAIYSMANQVHVWLGGLTSNPVSFDPRVLLPAKYERYQYNAWKTSARSIEVLEEYLKAENVI